MNTTTSTPISINCQGPCIIVRARANTRAGSLPRRLADSSDTMVSALRAHLFLGMGAALVAAQGNPGLRFPDTCAKPYMTAYMSMRYGECAGQTVCTPSCQAQINAVRNGCAGQMYNETDVDPITGIVAERSFAQQAAQFMQLMGPVDCDYYDAQRCPSECTVERVVATHQNPFAPPTAMGDCLSVDPMSAQDAPMAVFHSCEGSCRRRFEALQVRCSGCRWSSAGSSAGSDPTFSHFMADAGRKFVDCATGLGARCDAVEDTLTSVCRKSARADGDGVDIRAGRMPAWPANDGTSTSRATTCAAAVQRAGVQCPHSFVDNHRLLGLYLDSSSSLQQLLAAAGPVPTACSVYCDDLYQNDHNFSTAADAAERELQAWRAASTGGEPGASCEAPAVPAHAALGGCSKNGLASGERCEMTCGNGWCISGIQPTCENGELYSTMQCEPQPVATCSFPPNGGCDPLTTCSDSTNLFGKKLVQCSACPSGYYGSGRSGCYPINTCLVVRNGGCDRRTTCSDFAGGYTCSACEELGLVGNPYEPNGCHTWREDHGLGVEPATASYEEPESDAEPPKFGWGWIGAPGWGWVALMSIMLCRHRLKVLCRRSPRQEEEEDGKEVVAVAQNPCGGGGGKDANLETAAPLELQKQEQEVEQEEEKKREAAEGLAASLL
jgi:hypothetical protein